MHSFAYQNGILHCEGASLEALAAEHGTPLYVYSAATIRDHYRRLGQAFAPIDHQIAYAVKANPNLSVLRLLAGMGSGFDIVSGGELHRVLRAGGDPSKCTFAGVGKTREEITCALESGIHCFNAESESELRHINAIAGELGKTAPVALRVNPNVDAGTHEYISTGKSEDKFGIDFEAIPAAYERAAALPHLRLLGLQMHIGSQLTSVKPFARAVRKVAPLVLSLKEKHGIEFFSVGGGIGIVYEQALQSGSPGWWDDRPEAARPITLAPYAAALLPLLEPLGLKVILEPGRFIAGNAGVLLTRCLYEKKGASKTFKILDSGMHQLIRPALYQGHHQIVPVKEGDGSTETADVVGPICESGDFFCRDRELPAFGEGDLLALMSAGAYGFTMASTYNSHPLPAEILVDGSEARLARRRQTSGR